MSKFNRLVGVEGLVIMMIYTILPVSMYRFVEFEVLNSIMMFLTYLLISVCTFAYLERKYLDKGNAFILCIVPYSYGILNMIAAETEILWIKLILLLFAMVSYVIAYAYLKETFVDSNQSNGRSF